LCLPEVFAGKLHKLASRRKLSNSQLHHVL
jgi:hypothetical protein